MSKSLGGMSCHSDMVFARRACDYCKKDFIPGESKIREQDRFYHPKCFHKMVEAVGSGI